MSRSSTNRTGNEGKRTIANPQIFKSRVYLCTPLGFPTPSSSGNTSSLSIFTKILNKRAKPAILDSAPLRSKIRQPHKTTQVTSPPLDLAPRPSSSSTQELGPKEKKAAQS